MNYGVYLYCIHYLMLYNFIRDIRSFIEKILVNYNIHILGEISRDRDDPNGKLKNIKLSTYLNFYN
jgi:hypothetical protein